jgi:hypothetical protein
MAENDVEQNAPAEAESAPTPPNPLEDQFPAGVSEGEVVVQTIPTNDDPEDDEVIEIKETVAHDFKKNGDLKGWHKEPDPENPHPEHDPDGPLVIPAPAHTDEDGNEYDQGLDHDEEAK